MVFQEPIFCASLIGLTVDEFAKGYPRLPAFVNSDDTGTSVAGSAESRSSCSSPRAIRAIFALAILCIRTSVYSDSESDLFRLVLLRTHLTAVSWGYDSTLSTIRRIVRSVPKHDQDNRTAKKIVLPVGRYDHWERTSRGIALLITPVFQLQ